MPVIQIRFESERDLCLQLRAILKKLPPCEALPAGPVSRRRQRQLSRQLRSGSISEPDAQPDVSPNGEPTAQTPTFGEPTAISIIDPDDPEGGTRLFDIQPSTDFGDPTTFGPLEDDGFQVVQDESGRVTSQRKVPLDLKLVEAIAGKKRGPAARLIGRVILGLSQGAAALLPSPEKTISAVLAKSGGTTINAVHLGLLLPVIKVLGGIAGDPIREFLKDAADISLLEGNIEDLEAQVRQLDKGFDVPFLNTTDPGARKLFDRIRGNLELLRIQKQEEF